jgi:hypothetical protein
MNLEEFISGTEGEEIVEINNLFLMEEGLREGKLSGVNGPVSKEVIGEARIRRGCGVAKRESVFAWERINGFRPEN